MPEATAKKKYSEADAKKELGLLTLLHIFFAVLVTALLLYGITSPGPFTTMIEIQLEKPGQLPPGLINGILSFLGILSALNAVASFCLVKRSMQVVLFLVSVLNCITIVGIPLGLTTLFTVNKAEVKKFFQ